MSHLLRIRFSSAPTFKGNRTHFLEQPSPMSEDRWFKRSVKKVICVKLEKPSLNRRWTQTFPIEFLGEIPANAHLCWSCCLLYCNIPPFYLISGCFNQIVQSAFSSKSSTTTHEWNSQVTTNIITNANSYIFKLWLQLFQKKLFGKEAKGLQEPNQVQLLVEIKLWISLYDADRHNTRIADLRRNIEV